MESSCYAFKANVSLPYDEASPDDSLVRTRKVLPSWDFIVPRDNSQLGTFADSLNSLMERNCLEHVQTSSMPGRDEALISGNGGYGRAGSSSCSTRVTDRTSSFLQDDESFNSIMDSNSPESPLIDLNLGRLADQNKVKNCRRSKHLQVPPVLVSSVPGKRSCGSIFSNQLPRCQVQGCHMDLSTSKEYHRRHKVCEAHSKTAAVIVNGTEQRFCQQCSRFHLLAEFDDGKRSCRKRLAGHNERRRKIQPTKSDKFLRFAAPATSSFICSEIFQADNLHCAKYQNNTDWFACVKHNDAYSAPILAHGTGKHFTSEVLPDIFCYSKSNRHAHGLLEPHLPVKTSLGDEGSVFDITSTIEGLSMVSDADSALSLLSSRPQNSSILPVEISISDTVPTQTHGSGLYSVDQFQDGTLAVRAQGSSSIDSNDFSSGMKLMGDDLFGAAVLHDANKSPGFRSHSGATTSCDPSQIRLGYLHQGRVQNIQNTWFK